MASITARIAERHVTSLSWTPVATDPKRIELHLDADPRFAAAAGGAVRYLAETAGMSEEVCREFQSETVQACLQAFEAYRGHPYIVEFSRFEDRLEVVVNSNSGSGSIRLSRSVTAQT
jgi:hypothetical protein